MGTTSTFLIPYPEPTDPVANGAANMKAIADRVDLKLARVYTAETQSAGSTANGVPIDLGAICQTARGAGFAAITVAGKWHNGTVAMASNHRFTSAAAGNVVSAGIFEIQMTGVASGVGAWVGLQDVTAWVPITAGAKPQLVNTIYVANPGALWYYAARVHVAEYVTA